MQRTNGLMKHCVAMLFRDTKARKSYFLWFRRRDRDAAGTFIRARMCLSSGRCLCNRSGKPCPVARALAYGATTCRTIDRSLWRNTKNGQKNMRTHAHMLLEAAQRSASAKPKRTQHTPLQKQDQALQQSSEEKKANTHLVRGLQVVVVVAQVVLAGAAHHRDVIYPFRLLHH